MKLKSLAVIALLVLGCSFASAQSYTFGFASTGGGLFCNYEQLNNTSGFGTDVWQGVDNLSACGAEVNATIEGFSTVLPGSAGLPVAGSGVAYADNVYDAFSLGYTGAQMVVFTELKCNKPKGGGYEGLYRWLNISSASGLALGDDYGYLSCAPPAAYDQSVRERGTNAGNILKIAGK